MGHSYPEVWRNTRDGTIRITSLYNERYSRHQIQFSMRTALAQPIPCTVNAGDVLDEQ